MLICFLSEIAIRLVSTSALHGRDRAARPEGGGWPGSIQSKNIPTLTHELKCGVLGGVTSK